MIVQASALSKWYDTRVGAVHALREVDLTVPHGQITAVIGHSGAGKTTFGRCVNLLEAPSTGRLTLDGTDPWASSRAERIALLRRMGTVFQGSRLLTRRTALENVAYPLELAGVRRATRLKKAAELLDRVSLADKLDAYPRQLSGGQAQRVGIARALALGPELLVLDEATSGLDPATTAAILALLGRLHRDDDLTVVLITHEMEVVRALADWAVLLDRGRVVEQGAVADLVLRPGSRLGRDLLPDPHVPVVVGQRTFTVTYRRPDVRADWLVVASTALGAPLSLLSGTVDRLAGGTAGRLTVAAPDAVADRVPGELRALGLDAVSRADSVVVTP